jgi:hypothetical protein
VWKPRLEPTATTWVTRDKTGEMKAVPITEMTDAHLFRWIRYFRKKHRDEGFKGSDAALDQHIRIMLAPAAAGIFAEAFKRGVYKAPPPDPASTNGDVRFAGERPKEPTVVPGVRRIDLDEED